MGVPQNCIVDNTYISYISKIVSFKNFCINWEESFVSPTERYIKEAANFLRIMCYKVQEELENNLTIMEVFMNLTCNNTTEIPDNRNCYV